MSFNQGRDKSGGRKQGTPNRRTQNLIEILNEHNYSPVADLIEYSLMARANIKGSSDPAVQANWVKIGVSCASGLLPYVYPKRKPADSSTEITSETIGTYTTEQLVEHAKAIISEHEQ